MSVNLDYINQHFDASVKATKGTKLFPEVALIESMLESGNGKSYLASKYNNYFGIKADSSWNGKKVTLPTTEYKNGVKYTVNANFRAYNSFEDSVKDWVNFLKSNPRYTQNGVFDATTVEDQFRALKKSGYATAPTYDITLINYYTQFKDILNSKMAQFVKSNPLAVIIPLVMGAFFLHKYYYN